MKTFTTTFAQIQEWPMNSDGWHVDPNTGLSARVGTRKGDDLPITAEDRFRAGDDFQAEDNVVFGDNETPIYIQGRQTSIGYSGTPGFIRSGCCHMPIEWWLENVEQWAKECGYSSEEQKEYRLHVEHIVAWMKLYDQTRKGS